MRGFFIKYRRILAFWNQTSNIYTINAIKNLANLDLSGFHVDI